MGRFFMRSPKRGDPISMRGLARGIAKIARALEGMNVENGKVEWSAFDVPTIVFGDDGAGSKPGGITGRVPAGGYQYQVLAKDSDSDYDYKWDWLRYVVPE